VSEELEYEYDAFVSYTGSGNADPGAARLDREVAQSLIRLLETYRTPRSLSRERQVPRRLRRVFRDRDELAAATDLEASLIEPLRRSRFLIVVCSPRARNSRWVNQEIATFSQLRGEDHILTLLIEGEPGDAFPPALIRRLPSNEEVLPLGADIRAPTRRKSLRLLKSEKLRLLAPILGCRFDDLRQREHERAKRRMRAIVGGLLLLSVVLTSLVIFALIAEEKAKRRYRLALETQKTILPLVVSPPGDLATKETYLTNAVQRTEILCAEDPHNADCPEQLRSLRTALAEAHQLLGRPEPTDVQLGTSRRLSLQASLNRLRSWSPGKGRGSDELFEASPDYDVKRLRDLVGLWNRETGEAARVEDAVLYTEYASQLIERLDTTAPEGREEAHRLLERNLELFAQARRRQPLTPEQEELCEAVTATLERMKI
jgi:hypothetical protein